MKTTMAATAFFVAVIPVLAQPAEDATVTEPYVVTVVGAVQNPGVYQVRGRKTVVEMLALAGGLDPTLPAEGRGGRSNRPVQRGDS